MPRPRATIEPSKLIAAFADHGFQGASSEHLAALAGVSKPTLYAHGHSKESLFNLVVEVEVERLLQRLHRAEHLTRGRSARDRATGTAHAILNHAAERPEGIRLLARVAHDPSATVAPARATVDRVTDRIATMLRRDLVADGLDPFLAPTLARAIWGATLALATAPTGQLRQGRERLAAVATACVPAQPPPRPEDWATAS